MVLHRMMIKTIFDNFKECDAAVYVYCRQNTPDLMTIIFDNGKIYHVQGMLAYYVRYKLLKDSTDTQKTFTFEGWVIQYETKTRASVLAIIDADYDYWVNRLPANFRKPEIITKYKGEHLCQNGFDYTFDFLESFYGKFDPNNDYWTIV